MGSENFNWPIYITDFSTLIIKNLLEALLMPPAVSSLKRCHLWLLFVAVVGLCCFVGFSLVAVSESYSTVAVLELLPGEASLVVEQRLSGAWASGVAAGVLSSCGSRAAEHRLSSCDTWAQLLHSMWDLPRQGTNPCILHRQTDSLPLSHQGSP